MIDGIGRGGEAWEACVLPLNYARSWAKPLAPRGLSGKRIAAHENTLGTSGAVLQSVAQKVPRDYHGRSRPVRERRAGV